jgi:hypothetical protein
MKRSLPALALVLTTSACSHPPVPSPSSTLDETSTIATSAASVVAADEALVAKPPEAPPEPPYDLAADLETRKATLGATLGKKTKFELVEGVFLIAVPSGVMGSSAAVAKTALKAYFNERFAAHPPRAVTVLLFDTAPPYEAFCKSSTGEPCTTPFGFYDPTIRTVVMNAGPGIGTLTHELVHPIVDADFPAAPTWINEGIASLYEAFNFPKPGEIRGNKNFRHPTLLAALKSKEKRTLASLPRLFAMTDTEFRGAHEGLNYATARYFCMWMDGQKKLWPFYHAWRDDVAHDPTGEKAFVATMGKTPAELDAAWAAWVKAL